MEYHMRLSLGSLSDWKMGNVFLGVMSELGVRVHVSVGSCHWSAGEEFTSYIASIEEYLVAIMGGMSLAAPGISVSTIRNLEEFDKIVFGIPLDEAALSALQDLPAGIPVLTCGLNKQSVTASVTNAALAIAQLIGLDNPKIKQKIAEYYRAKRNKKGIIENLELDKNGLIPDPNPRRVL